MGNRGNRGGIGGVEGVEEVEEVEGGVKGCRYSYSWSVKRRTPLHRRQTEGYGV